MTRSRLFTVPVVVGIALVLAACSGSTVTIDAAEPEPTPTAVPPTPTPTVVEITTVIAEGTEDAIAQQLLLDDSVLPGEWGSEPRDDSNDSTTDELMSEIMTDLDVCAPMLEAGFLDDGEFRIVAQADHRAESPTYIRGDDEVGFTASVFDSIEEAETTFDVVESLSVDTCFAELLPEFVRRGVSTSDVFVEVFDIRSSRLTMPGEDGWGFDLTIGLSVDGDVLGDLRFVIAAVRYDRAVVSTSISLIGTTLDTDAVVAAMDQRLTEVLGEG